MTTVTLDVRGKNIDTAVAIIRAATVVPLLPTRLRVWVANRALRMAKIEVWCGTRMVSSQSLYDSGVRADPTDNGGEA